MENAMLEYQAEQDRIAAKAEQKREYEARVMEKLYPSSLAPPGPPEEPRPRGDDWPAPRVEEPAPVGLAVHPWQSNYNGGEGYQMQQKTRATAHAIMEENRRAAEARRNSALHSKAEEISSHAATLASEQQWWNLGASTERWIPKELRRRGRAMQPLADEPDAAKSNILAWLPSETAAKSTAGRDVGEAAGVPTAAATAPFATFRNVPPGRTEVGRCHATTVACPFARSDDTPVALGRAVSMQPPAMLRPQPPPAALPPWSTDDVEPFRKPRAAPVRPPPASSVRGPSATGFAPFARDDQPFAIPVPQAAQNYSASRSCPFGRDD